MGERDAGDASLGKQTLFHAELLPLGARTGYSRSGFRWGRVGRAYATPDRSASARPVARQPEPCDYAPIGGMILPNSAISFRKDRERRSAASISISAAKAA